MTGIDASEWAKLSNEDKTKYFANKGDVGQVIYMMKKGSLEKLPEQQQRSIVATALNSLAELIDRQSSQGIHPTAIEDNDYVLATAGSSLRHRARATRILWNPDGEALMDQLGKLFDPE